MTALDALDLHLGEVPSLHAQNDHWRYAPPSGDQALREALAAAESIDPSRLCVTVGASLALTVLALLFPKHQFLLPRPWYPGYLALLTALGNKTACYNLKPEDGYTPDMETLERHLAASPSVILWNFPHNPTGAMAGLEALTQLNTIVGKYDGWVVSDEVYRPFVYKDEAGVTWPEAVIDPDRLFRIRSFSKCWSLAGERIGWAISPSKQAAEFTRTHWRVAMSVSRTSQKLALNALRRIDIAERLEQLRSCRDQVYSHIAASQYISCDPPQSGVFIWAKVALPGYDLDNTTITHRLLQKLQLRIPVGDEFGVSASFLRIPFATSGLAINAVNRLDDGLRQLAHVNSRPK